MIRCGKLCGLLLKGRQWVRTNIQVYGGLRISKFLLEEIPSVSHVCLFHINIHEDIYMYIMTYTYAYAYIHAYMHIHIHLRIHIHIHIDTDIHIHMHMNMIYAYTYTNTNTHANT